MALFTDTVGKVLRKGAIIQTPIYSHTPVVTCRKRAEVKVLGHVATRTEYSKFFFKAAQMCTDLSPVSQTAAAPSGTDAVGELVRHAVVQPNTRPCSACRQMIQRAEGTMNEE
jgi:hypothetical protein